MYTIKAETKDGEIGICEHFKYRHYALKAAKAALKRGMKVTCIERTS